MGFHSDQVDYEFTGNKTEITKQIGNAVSVLQAKALVKAMFADAKELF
jgi:site-specific DNA-cytosine methylase